MDDFNIELTDDWSLISSEEITDDGSAISQSNYNAEDWYTTSVPKTVLAALVDNGVYENIYFGRKLDEIPREQFEKSWWYRKEISLDASYVGKSIDLELDGIIYYANLWINGKLVADKELLKGAFKMHKINITDFVQSGTNVIALEVFPRKDGDFSVGFVDWNPVPPDQNMGLWRNARLHVSGYVKLNYPVVRSKINLKDYSSADLFVEVTATNNTDKPIDGEVVGEIDGIKFTKPVKLDPRNTKVVSFSVDEFEQLRVNNPKLWWTHDFGEPNLYDIELTFLVNNDVSDYSKTRFGIREVETYVNEAGHKGFKLNGKPILIKGAGWVDDLLLDNDSTKVKAQVDYVKHMNLNTIRLEGYWGNNHYLYDLCDEAGVLLMPGWSCQWEWEGYLGKKVHETFGGIISEDDRALVTEYFRDHVLWLRNHPSVFMYGGGSDMLLHPELEKTHIAVLDELDPTRPFLNSHQSITSEVTGKSGVKMLGPYDYVPPIYWYEDTENGGAYGFNTETGPGPQPPVLETVKRMIPEEDLWPLNKMWDFHAGRNEFNSTGRYVNALDKRYGKATDLNDFLKKSQAASYEAMRPMFEAFRANKFNSTGVIQWMLNSAWPETFWQLYDYYLIPTGAFYAAQKACQPQQLIYNYNDNSVYISNADLEKHEGLVATIKTFDAESKEVSSEVVEVVVGANSSKKIYELPVFGKDSDIHFISLELRDEKENLIADNFYWVASKDDKMNYEKTTWWYTPQSVFADFTALNDLPETEVQIVSQKTSRVGKVFYEITLTNKSKKISFFNYLKIVDEEGNTIVPAFWSDNYISLLPEQTKKITCEIAEDVLRDKNEVIKFEGWNTKPVFK